MGWEYHNRERTQRGRWKGGEVKSATLKVRCTDTTYEQIRAQAYASKMSISEYVLDLVARDRARMMAVGG